MSKNFPIKAFFFFQIFNPGWHKRLVFCVLFSILFAVKTYPDTVFPNDFSDTITVGTEPDYPPYCFLGKDGKPEGFAVDVINAAASEAGLFIDFKIGLWSYIRQELIDGEIDALPFVARTAERENQFDFTLTYLTLEGAVFALKDDKTIKTTQDLKNKRILVMKGDNSHEYVARENLSPRILAVNTLSEAFKKMVNGEGDVVVTQHIIGIKLIEQLNLQRKVKALNINLNNFNQDFGIAVKKGDIEKLRKLNDGLSIIIANNTFSGIQEKWFGPGKKEKISAADFVRVTLIIIAPFIALIVLLWIIFLRREVERRTERIYQEIAEHQTTLSNLKLQQILVNESEQQIRLLLNSTAEGIYGIDINGICTFINHSGLEILGYEDSDNFIGKNIHNLIHHTKPDGTPNEIEDCIIHASVLQGNRIVDVNDFLWRKDNTSFMAEFSSFPIIKDDRITGAVVTFRDITERRQAEEELLQLKNELEQKVIERTAELEEKVQKLAKSQKAMLFMVEDLNRITTELKAERRKLEISNKELDSFTYSVSHDLRAPLRAINGFSGFLIEDYYDKLDEEGQRYIRIIKENATRMDHLINDMLMLSRISRTERKTEMVDFNQVVHKIIEDHKPELKNQDFQFVVSVLPEVKCDLSLLKQVWTNLISNAIKYTSKSEVRKIEISAEENSQETIFSVKDSGAGFDPKYAHKLFGVFQRLHTDAEFEGTGVGLAIVKQIIQLHGGRVFAESELGKGATFYFTLPKRN